MDVLLISRFSLFIYATRFRYNKLLFVFIVYQYFNVIFVSGDLSMSSDCVVHIFVCVYYLYSPSTISYAYNHLLSFEDV